MEDALVANRRLQLRLFRNLDFLRRSMCLLDRTRAEVTSHEAALTWFERCTNAISDESLALDEDMCLAIHGKLRANVDPVLNAAENRSDPVDALVDAFCAAVNYDVLAALFTEEMMHLASRLRFTAEFSL